jgi:hypothetical protein
MPPVSRRSFNKAMIASIAAVYGTPFLPRHVWAEAAAALGLPNVALVTGANADLPEAYLRTALAGLGGISRFVKAGQTVALKVNVTWDAPPNTASNTDPELLRAMIKLVREAGASRVIVTDHVIGSDTSASVTLPLSGIDKVIEDTKVEKAVMAGVDEPDDRYVSIDAPKSKSVDGKRFSVIKAATQADVRINMAVAKSHIVTPVTMTLKHMMGLMRYPGYLHTVNLDQGIADINTAEAIRCDLHLLEAFRVRLTGAAWGWGNESQPDPRDPSGQKIVKRFNQILAGTDPVLIDSYGADTYFKGYKPDAKGILHILRAYQAGLGEMDAVKAAAEGRFQTFTVGQAMFQAAATPTAFPTQAPGVFTPTATAAVAPTATLRRSDPVSAVAPASPTARPQAATGAPIVSTEVVYNYVPALSGAMVPVVAIVAALGLVVRRRLERAGDRA